MTRKKASLLIPLLLIAGLLLYTWITVLSGDYIFTWRHYVGLVLVAPLIYLFKKNIRKALLGTIIYLGLGICNVLVLTPAIIWNSYGIRIGSANITTPPFQILSFGLLVLLCILNFDTLIDMYLDFKEMRQTKTTESIQADSERIVITGTTFN